MKKCLFFICFFMSCLVGGCAPALQVGAGLIGKGIGDAHESTKNPVYMNNSKTEYPTYKETILINGNTVVIIRSMEPGFYKIQMVASNKDGKPLGVVEAESPKFGQYTMIEKRQFIKQEYFKTGIDLGPIEAW